MRCAATRVAARRAERTPARLPACRVRKRDRDAGSRNRDERESRAFHHGGIRSRAHFDCGDATPGGIEGRTAVRAAVQAHPIPRADNGPPARSDSSPPSRAHLSDSVHQTGPTRGQSPAGTPDSAINPPWHDVCIASPPNADPADRKETAMVAHTTWVLLPLTIFLSVTGAAPRASPALRGGRARSVLPACPVPAQR